MDLADRHSTMARLVTFFAGFPATEVWKTYSQYEQDEQFLIDLLETMTNEAKPILEERARRGRR